MSQQQIPERIRLRVFGTLLKSCFPQDFRYARNGVGGVEVVIKLILYYFHERLWEIIPIGKKKHPLSEIAVKRALDQKDLELIKSKLEELGYFNE
ncbi:DUF2061 domain-containing protein [Candidatus Sumerlaeota bacterium]|nr:DUF2061 domain-containing protein [Candidatus Sumerlaeota bacterium]